MTKISRILTFLLALWTTHMSVAYSEVRSATENFLYANELYKQENYKDAFKGYDLILNKSPQVFYNMGNCAYHLGKLGKALAYWRKAEHNWGLSSREELTSNIELVKKELAPEGEKPSTGLKKITSTAGQQIVSFVKAIQLFWFQLAVLALWCLFFLYLRYLHHRRQRFIIVLLFSLLFCSVGLLVLKYSLTMLRYGVIVSKQTSLRAGPGETYKILGSLEEGDEVRIQKQSDDFYKISYKGSIGWVALKDIETI